MNYKSELLISDKNCDTKLTILWLQKLCRLYPEEIKCRCQETIGLLFSGHNTEDLQELGEIIWDDLTGQHRILQRFPPPTIDIQVVEWSDVAEYLVQLLKLELNS